MLSTLLKPYISALIGSVCIAFGILTFSNPNLFAPLFIAFLIVSALALHKNINVLGVILIILMFRLLEELAWHTYQAQSTTLQIAIAAAAAFTAYKLWYNTASKILGVTMLIYLLAGLYAQLYPVILPNISWYLLMASIAAWANHLIFYRTYLTKQLNKPASPTVLDAKAMGLFSAFLIADCIMIADYLIRHLIYSPDILLVYNLYPYVIHIIGTVMLWLIFEENHHYLAPRIYKA